MRLYVFLILSLSIIQNINAQSPWVQKEDDFYYSINYKITPKYDHLFDRGDSERITSREITESSFVLYGEVGLTDNITFLFDFPFRSLKAGEQTQDPTYPSTIEKGRFLSIGNIGVGARHALIKSKYQLSLELMLKLKTSRLDDTKGLITDYDAWSAIPTINFGFSKDFFYAQCYGGFDFKTNNYSASLKAGARAGVYFLKRFWVIGFLNYQDSFENGSYRGELVNRETGLFLNNQEYLAYGGEVRVNITDLLGLSFTYDNVALGHWIPIQYSLSGGFYMNI